MIGAWAWWHAQKEPSHPTLGASERMRLFLEVAGRRDFMLSNALGSDVMHGLVRSEMLPAVLGVLRGRYRADNL
jgi:hypothetical protein